MNWLIDYTQFLMYTVFYVLLCFQVINCEEKTVIGDSIGHIQVSRSHITD